MSLTLLVSSPRRKRTSGRLGEKLEVVRRSTRSRTMMDCLGKEDRVVI